MPSQFPGMDPYLEGPAIWPDFHDAFAGEIRNQLNHTLPAPYCARLEIREVLESDANLVEIDLLRAGDRLLSSPHLRDLLGKLEPACDYVVLVNRHWRRVTDGTGYQVFPFGLKEMMPCIPVPLRQGEPEVPLDLQYLFNMAYDGGPYERGAVDYARDPDPPLQGDDAAWATEVLRAARSG